MAAVEVAAAAAVAAKMPFFRVALLFFIFSQRAWSVGIQVDVIPNFVGVGVGVTTEWLGSKDTITALVPGASSSRTTDSSSSTGRSST